MTAREIIEAEDPKSAMQGRWGNPDLGAVTSAFTRLRLPLTIAKPVNAKGDIVCDEFRSLVDLPEGRNVRLSVCLTVWRGYINAHSHSLIVSKGYDRQWVSILRENSSKVRQLVHWLEYAVNFILPKLHGMPPKEAKRQADALRNREAARIMAEAEDPKSALRAASARVKYRVVAMDCSWGLAEDGKVLWFRKDPHPLQPDDDYLGIYPHVVKFDLAEYLKYWGDIPSVIDISDVGFWDKYGNYDPADEHYRQDIKSGSIAR